MQRQRALQYRPQSSLLGQCSPEALDHFGPDVIDKTDTDPRIRQGAKRCRAGAFGMNAAVRESSLDACRRFFDNLRTGFDRVPASGKS